MYQKLKKNKNRKKINAEPHYYSFINLGLDLDFSLYLSIAILEEPEFYSFISKKGEIFLVICEKVINPAKVGDELHWW